ncbi:MAG: apocytochrome f [Prochloraceae cyanobacterium]|nr:apocytochrome f [Prochloraceae cyanobacterium]
MITENIVAICRKVGKAIASFGIVAIATLAFLLASDLILPSSAAAYPFWAQQTAPETPREATGRIVCANCHLAEKAAEIEIPHSVLPDRVFDAVVKIPYDLEAKEIYGDGSEGDLQVGAVLMLPEGFKIAPEDRIPAELQEKVGGIYYQEYQQGQENVVMVGPLPGSVYAEEGIHFPILSPNPATDKNVNFGKFSVHVGANRGRGQIGPAGNMTNNNQFRASASGTIAAVTASETGGYEITIDKGNASVVELIPPGPQLIVAEGEAIAEGQPLTEDPNVGGFGQKDTEIVLQSSTRVAFLVGFLGLIMLAQLLLVIKKKQVERVQAAEMNF